MENNHTPLLDALAVYKDRHTLRFHMPGHKGRALPGNLFADTCALDVTELSDTGDLYRDPPHTGPIRAAEALYAKTYDTKDALFITGGASQGIFGMLAGAAQPGDAILVDRLCHQSVCHAIALLDLHPTYLMRELRASDGIALPLTPSALTKALANASNTTYKAVLLTSPSYHGVCCDLSALGEICRHYGIPLLVDGAHGAHLPFVPPYEVVPASVAAMVLSAHKTLPALGQAAFLLLNDPLSVGRVRQGLQLVGTSSPSYPIMASLDAARSFLDNHGRNAGKLLTQLLQNFTSPFLFRDYPFQDPLRLVLRFSEAPRANQWLAAQGVRTELTDTHTVVLIISLYEDVNTLKKLLSLLTALEAVQPDNQLPPDNGDTLSLPLPSQILSIREALFSRKTETLPLQDAVGMVAAAPLTPYPPGIPLLMPGELLDRHLLAAVPDITLRHTFLSNPAANIQRIKN